MAHHGCLPPPRVIHDYSTHGDIQMHSAMMMPIDQYEKILSTQPILFVYGMYVCIVLYCIVM